MTATFGSHLPEHFEKIIIAQMAFDEVPTNTIRFFKLVYPHLRNNPEGLSQIHMSEITHLAPSGLKIHLLKLTRLGYLLRRSWTKWVLPTRFPINDPLLQAMARSL